MSSGLNFRKKLCARNGEELLVEGLYNALATRVNL